MLLSNITDGASGKDLLLGDYLPFSLEEIQKNYFIDTMVE